MSVLAISSNLWKFNYMFVCSFPAKSPTSPSSPLSSLEHFLWDFCEAVSWAIVLSKMWNKLNSQLFMHFSPLLHSLFTISFLVKELKHLPVVFLSAWTYISPWVTVVYLYYKNFILSNHLQVWASSLSFLRPFSLSLFSPLSPFADTKHFFYQINNYGHKL